MFNLARHYFSYIILIEHIKESFNSRINISSSLLKHFKIKVIISESHVFQLFILINIGDFRVDISWRLNNA